MMGVQGFQILGAQFEKSQKAEKEKRKWTVVQQKELGKV